MIELKIDPEFRDKIPPLTDAEFEQLKDNILADGEVYEPICVWGGTIVDGHNRWKIVQEHPEIPFRTKEMHFTDKWEAFDWMYKKQLGRRNLTDEQRTVLIGKMFEARKNLHGGDRKSKDQNGPLIKGDTAQAIADEIGVGRNTVKRAEKFAKGIDKIAEISPEAVGKILAGNSGINKAAVMDLVKKNEDEVKEFAELVVSGEAKQQKKKKSGNPASLVQGGFSKEEREQMAQMYCQQEAHDKELTHSEKIALSKRIDEIDKLISDTEAKHVYTEEDAEEEFEILMNEFVSKIRRVIEVRNDVVKGSKKLKSLLYMFSNELKKLREEI